MPDPRGHRARGTPTVISSLRDPSIMTPAERLAELVEALAKGYLRLLVSRQKELEAGGKLEALCAPPVDGQEMAATRKEPA